MPEPTDHSKQGNGYGERTRARLRALGAAATYDPPLDPERRRAYARQVEDRLRSMQYGRKR